MGDTDMDDMELINEIMADDGEQAMVDSGASSNILVMGRGRSGVFRMCSKITPTRTSFSTYGKGTPGRQTSIFAAGRGYRGLCSAILHKRLL